MFGKVHTRQAAKLVSSVKHLSYDDRLKQLRLTALKYRRLTGDIAVYMIKTVL